MRPLKKLEQLDLKLQEINRKLLGFGVPFSLTRLGNFKKGDWQINDVVAVFAQKKFKIAVGFILLAPWTGERTEYWCQFNSTYSSEALSGHIVIPVVNGTHFLMMRSYGPFIGEAPLMFPHGFIPQTSEDLTAKVVAESLIERKILDCVKAVEGSLQGEPQILRSARGTMRLAEDQSTSGNWLTVSVVQIKLELIKFEARIRKYRAFKLVDIDDFLQRVSAGEIVDLHSLSAYVAFTAVSKG